MSFCEFVAWDRFGPEPQQHPLPPSREVVNFSLLGPFRMLADGRDLAPTAPKLRQMLAVLLLRAGEVTPNESIEEELWPGGPPSSAQSTVQNYVYQLRSLLRQAGVGRPEELLVTTQRLGYTLFVRPEQVDAHRFQAGYGRARFLMGERRFAEAAAELRHALALWSGPPLAGVRRGPFLSGVEICLQELRRNARILRVQAEIEAGHHVELADELIAELRSLIGANPLDEVVHAQLIRVLHDSGRRGDAQRAYRTLCANLDRHLGLEPGAELRRLHRELVLDGAAPRRAERWPAGC